MSTTHLERKKVTIGSVHLDALRGAAAILVFINHTRALCFTRLRAPDPVIGSQSFHPMLGLENVRSPAPLFGEIHLANEAVAIFFVLSGFLVGGSVLKSFRQGRWQWGEYGVKRFTRLLIVLIPSLILGCSLDVIGFRAMGPGSMYSPSLLLTFNPAEHEIARLTPAVIAGNSLFLQGVLVEHAGSNLSLWSLSFEFWYYLLFPVAILTCISRSWRAVAFWLFLFVALLAFVGPTVAALFPLWCLGALVAWIQQRQPQLRHNLSAFSAVGLLGSMLAARSLHMSMIAGFYLVGAFTGALVYFLSFRTQEARPSLYRSISSYFSKISYTLYLVHMPVALFLYGWIDRPWQHWSNELRYLLQYSVIVAMTLGIATLLWWCFESHTDVVRRKLFSRFA